MEYASALLIVWAIIIGVVYSTGAGGRGLRCPTCARGGRAIIEEARFHTGWDCDDSRLLRVYTTRHQLRCQRCGHRWLSED